MATNRYITLWSPDGRRTLHPLRPGDEVTLLTNAVKVWTPAGIVIYPFAAFAQINLPEDVS